MNRRDGGTQRDFAQSRVHLINIPHAGVARIEDKLGGHAWARIYMHIMHWAHKDIAG